MGSLITTTPRLDRRSLTGTAHALRRIASDITVFVDDHPASAFALLSVTYLGIVSALSHTKLLWLDELITLHIVKLGSPVAIWHALAQAADPNPPLTHLAVLGALRLFGEHEFALRLPAILGYWIGILSLFLFLKQRISPTWAMAGVILSMVNGAFDYSYESRSYGIFYGLAMLAILCWSRTVDPTSSSTRRSLALGGMILALAAGICTNYFAVLAFFPIAGGEIVRTLRPSLASRSFKRTFLRTVDLRVWFALVLAATPLIAFRSLIQRSIQQFAPHAWNKVSLDQVFDSYTGMVETSLFPIVALFAFAVVVYLLSRFCSHCRAAMRPRWLSKLASRQASFDRPSFPLHEGAAALLLMLYPFLGYLIASIHGGMLSPRFVIPVCLGFAITGIAVCHRIFGHIWYSGAATFGICLLLFLSRVVDVGYIYHQQRLCFYKVLQQLPAASANKPIVVPDPLMVLTLQHYAPPEISSRIVFPVDFPVIRLLRGEDSPDENLWAGREFIYHLPIVPLADFQRNASDYLILASDHNWLVRDLWAHSYPVDRLPTHFPHDTIGGFTPLNHGDPALFVAAGDRSPRAAPHICPAPTHFHAAANLPSAPSLKPDTGGN